MVKQKPLTESSVLRVFSQFKDIPISTIALVQSLYSNQDWQQIKKVLNRPKIRKNTALAYGRLASQYVRLLDNPIQEYQDTIKDKYKISLVKDYYQNLVLSGNEKRGITPPPIVNVPDLIRLGGVLGVWANGNTVAEINNPDTTMFLRDLQILHQYVGLVNKYGISYYRVYAEFSTQSGNHIFMSTSVLKIPNYRIIEDFILKSEGYVNSASLYEYEDEIETIKDLVSIVVEYM